jgi:hypothetical protein
MRGRCGREVDWTGDVDRRYDADLCGNGSPWNAVGRVSERQVKSRIFCISRVLSGLQQVEIAVGHHDVVGLPADPSAHIDISIGVSGPVGVDVKADTGVDLSTGPAAAACDLEGDRDEVANLEMLDVTAHLDHFAGDLVSERHAERCRATLNHVLVGAADICRYDLEDDAVVDRLSGSVAV